MVAAAIEVVSSSRSNGKSQRAKSNGAILEKKPHRLQVDLPPRSLERLSRLKEVTEAPSNAEVVRNSLRLYEAMVNEVQSGRQFMVKEPNGAILPFNVFLEA